MRKVLPDYIYSTVSGIPILDLTLIGHIKERSKRVDLEKGSGAIIYGPLDRLVQFNGVTRPSSYRIILPEELNKLILPSRFDHENMFEGGIRIIRGLEKVTVRTKQLSPICSGASDLKAVIQYSFDSS